MRNILPLVRGVLASLAFVADAAGTGQTAERERAAPVEPIAAIVEAFRTHDLVAISDPHGNLPTQTFLRTLLRDSRVAAVVNDIVVEIGNAQYQALVDHYVQGGRVTLDDLRPVWQDTTVPNQVWADEDLFAIVRTINASRAKDRRLRILLGDPPIDWSTVRRRDALRELDPAVASWTARLGTARGTRLGAADIALLSPTPSRMTFRDGAVVPVPQDQWRTMAIEDQLDAVLGLGPRDEMPRVDVPARACGGAGFLEERLRRIALTGIPALEADRVRRLCAPPTPRR
jgi:hypothetical protein